MESRSSSTRARKRIRDYNNSGAERFLPREQRTNTQILIGDPPISASIHNLVQISTMSRQQRRSTQMQFAYPRPFSALYVAGSGKGWKGVAMVEGGSIFGKYLWRVETTELERTYSISLPALVERRMFVSRSEYHSGAPGKSRGSVGVIESVIHQRSSGMLIPPVADVHRSLGKKKKRKNARHRCRYFRREWPRCLEPPSSIDRIFQRSLTFDSIKFITIVRGFGGSEDPTIVATRAKRRTK